MSFGYQILGFGSGGIKIERECQYLVVAGGAGGGAGGGKSAGRTSEDSSNLILEAGDYTDTVGAFHKPVHEKQ